MPYTQDYIQEAIQILQNIDQQAVENMLDLLIELRANNGRLFMLGVGGSAANASHAVNDFRKIANIETYTPTDNVSELTARVNDESWESVFVNWLKGSRFKSSDMLFVLSVGGGDLERNISPNLVRALEYAQSIDAKIIGIVGRNGGYTAQVANACVIVPSFNASTVTPQSEAFQAVIWHLLVSHPRLREAEMKWETASR